MLSLANLRNGIQINEEVSTEYKSLFINLNEARTGDWWGSEFCLSTYVDEVSGTDVKGSVVLSYVSDTNLNENSYLMIDDFKEVVSNLKNNEIVYVGKTADYSNFGFAKSMGWLVKSVAVEMLQANFDNWVLGDFTLDSNASENGVVYKLNFNVKIK